MGLTLRPKTLASANSECSFAVRSLERISTILESSSSLITLGTWPRPEAGSGSHQAKQLGRRGQPQAPAGQLPEDPDHTAVLETDPVCLRSYSSPYTRMCQLGAPRTPRALPPGTPGPGRAYRWTGDHSRTILTHLQSHSQDPWAVASSTNREMPVPDRHPGPRFCTPQGWQ